MVTRDRSGQRLEGIHNLKDGHGRESEWPIVAGKSWKQDGAKGPHFSHVLIEEGRSRLSQRALHNGMEGRRVPAGTWDAREGLSSEMETGLQG